MVYLVHVAIRNVGTSIARQICIVLFYSACTKVGSRLLWLSPPPVGLELLQWAVQMGDVARKIVFFAPADHQGVQRQSSLLGLAISISAPLAQLWLLWSWK